MANKNHLNTFLGDLHENTLNDKWTHIQTQKLVRFYFLR